MNTIWLNACKKYNITDEIAIKWFNSIQLNITQDSTRYFHNWNEHLMKKSKYLDDPIIHPAIIFSIFFQYYEFDVKKNCFDKNCKEFLKFCSEANLKDDKDNTIKRTLKLLGDDSIEETSNYNDDIQFLQDLDLIILGSPPNDYKNYSELLRKEYNHMDDKTYNAMRRNNSSPNVTYNNLPSISTGNPTTVSTKKKKRNNKNLSSPTTNTNNRKKNLLKSSSNKKNLSNYKNNLLLRKSIQNQKKELLATKKQLIYDNMTSTPKNSISNNKHQLNQKELDCILIEESGEIIVIDDDDDDDDEQNNDTVRKDISKLSITDNPNKNEKFNISKDEEIKTSNLNNIINSQSSENTSNKEQCLEVNQVININNKITKNEIQDNKRNNLKDNEISEKAKHNIELTHENEKIVKPNDIKELQMNYDKVTSELPEYTRLYETILSDESFNSESSIIQHNNYCKNDNNNATIICLDDENTIRNNSKNISDRLRSSVQRNDDTDLDDSIIFVSESIDLDKFKPSTSSKALDYIPLSMNPPSDDFNLLKRHKLDAIKQNDFKKMKTHFSPLTKRIGGDLFTASEHKKILSYNTNAYNPNKESDDQQPKTGKRMVLIDGSNVAFQHALNKTFSVKGLQICIEYFEKMGYDVKAIVPQFRLQKYKSTEPEKLEKLHSDGKIVFTPCKNLPGKCSSSYDDRFLLQLATELDAAIVSNDNYRDLINENPAFKKIIENRVIGYTWCNDLFILPKDPYGRLGPTLNTILNRI